MCSLFFSLNQSVSQMFFRLELDILVFLVNGLYLLRTGFGAVLQPGSFLNSGAI